MYVTAHLPRANGITNEYASKNLDHLGIVSTICREINLASEINRIVGVDPRQKVTCGEAVVAMILNALGFVDRPLYLFPEFMTTKPVELLIGAGFKPEDFNDDVLGRTLDKLYRAGSEREMVKNMGSHCRRNGVMIKYGCGTARYIRRRTWEKFLLTIHG